MVHIYIQSTPCCNFFWEWGIGASIKEKILLSQDFYISNDGSRLNSLKNSRRSDSTLIINITESIINKEIEIDDLARKVIYLVMMLIGLESTRITLNLF